MRFLPVKRDGKIIWREQWNEGTNLKWWLSYKPYGHGFWESVTIRPQAIRPQAIRPIQIRLHAHSSI